MNYCRVLDEFDEQEDIIKGIFEPAEVRLRLN